MSHTTESQNRRRRHGGRRRTAEPSGLDIRAAIPAGSQRAESQPAALRALEARITLDADLGMLRSDAEKNALLVARAIVFSANWETMTCRPGWDTLTERCKLSRSTIAKYLGLFHTWGLLGRVASGSTWRTRGSRSRDENGNLAGEYVLCVPATENQQVDAPVEETRTPTLLRKEESSTAGETSPTRARARETQPWPVNQPAATRGEQRQAAKRLLDQEPILRPLRAKRLADLLESWFNQGWTLAQVRYALNHTPDGEQRWHTSDVRHPAGWLRHRLGQWDGQLPPRQLGAGQATDLTAADVAALPRPTAPTADVTAHASAARRLLAATLKNRSDKPQRLGLGVNLPAVDGQTLTRVIEEPAAAPAPADGDADWLLRNITTRGGHAPVGFEAALEDYRRGVA